MTVVGRQFITLSFRRCVQHDGCSAACSRVCLWQDNGSRDTALLLTTSRHAACFPTNVRICCVAPQSDMAAVVRIATVVGSVSNATVRIQMILVIVMLMRRLRSPGLAGSAVHCYRCGTEVVMSVRWRVARVWNTCIQYSRHFCVEENLPDTKCYLEHSILHNIDLQPFLCQIGLHQRRRNWKRFWLLELHCNNHKKSNNDSKTKYLSTKVLQCVLKYISCT